MKNLIVSLNTKSAQALIYQIIRDGKTHLVMIDRDLAQFYNSQTSHINRAAAKRNPKRFQGKVFQLTKEEYIQILKLRSKNPELQGKESFEYTRGIIPTAYTEKGFLALSSVLNSEASDQVFEVLSDSFLAMKQLIKNKPDILMRQDIYEIKNSISNIEKNLVNYPTLSQPQTVIQNLNNHGQIQIGNQNSMVIKINDYTDIIRLMTEILDHPEIRKNKAHTQEVKEAIVLATKEKPKDLLTQVEKVASITNTVVDLAVKASPILLPIMAWLKSLS